MERTALLLELIGFIMASFLVGILYINAIKNLADRFKSAINRSATKYEQRINIYSARSKPHLTSIYLKCLNLLSFHPYIVIKQLSLITLDSIRYLINKDEKQASTKKVIDARLRVVLASSNLIYLSIYGIFWLTPVEIFIAGITHIIYFLLKSFTGKEAITKFLIIIGTAIALSGLILETIFVWLR